jgi:hypothetical protein
LLQLAAVFKRSYHAATEVRGHPLPLGGLHHAEDSKLIYEKGIGLKLDPGQISQEANQELITLLDRLHHTIDKDFALSGVKYTQRGLIIQDSDDIIVYLSSHSN